MKPDDAQLSHVLPGRLRVKIPTRRHDVAYFEDVIRRLSQCEGVDEVIVNSLTASVLIIHSISDDAVAAYASEQGLFRLRLDLTASNSRIVARPASPAPRLSTVDPISASDRRAGVLSASLASLGILQTLRSQVMVPAISLLWYAYDTWKSRPSTRPGPPPTP
ncbi:HMA2 domain-containing protein [Cupriavidus sp. H39]|uniref:HMA2 domain-containing protein n=1 Tax=Cupriavidus sp. H39 TaxID=3401635 RepID=UPI003CFF4F04